MSNISVKKEGIGAEFEIDDTGAASVKSGRSAPRSPTLSLDLRPDFGSSVGGADSAPEPKLTGNTVSARPPPVAPMEDIGLIANKQRRRSTDPPVWKASPPPSTARPPPPEPSSPGFGGGFGDDGFGGADPEDDYRSHHSFAPSHHSDDGFNQPPPQPQPTYEEIQREKQELLIKLDRLRKAGVPISRVYTMSSKIEDVRYEYEQIKRQRDVAKSIRFCRKMLMGVVSGVEYVNTTYDPFNIRLEGWSENCMDNISDYDEVFEELHDKYGDKVHVMPELRLLMMVAGSAFMFHFTNSMFKSQMPDIDEILRQNPDIAQNLAQATMANMAQRGGHDPNDPLVGMVSSGVNMVGERRQQMQNNSGPRAPPAHMPGPPPPRQTRTPNRGPSAAPSYSTNMDSLLDQLGSGAPSSMDGDNMSTTSSRRRRRRKRKNSAGSVLNL